MLKQRIITAAVLLFILIDVLIIDNNWPFMIFVIVLAVCATWEWVRLTWQGPRFVIYALPCLVTVVALLQSWSIQNDSYVLSQSFDILVILCACIWVLGMPLILARGRADDPSHSLVLTLFAPIAMLATWWVFVSIFVQRGSLYLLSLLILVWVADLAAFFVGRRWGKHKLAPSISPGKTREGAIAGLVAVVVWLLASATWPGSFAEDLLDRWSWFGLVVWGVVLGALSVMGDLFESLLKRRAHVKDSSRLLPGHGGVYDRIDAVVVVLPVAFVLISIVYLQ
jgi:phosphatidate cytidylyltransferase